MKKTIIATVLVLSSAVASAGLSDGEAAILGIIIGTQIQRHIQQAPQPVYRQQEIYYPPQQPRQNTDPCQNAASTVEAAYCRGVQQRQREIIRNMEKEAYNRGYGGN